ncbi:9655_t:CDS:2, partial [Acaulospora morrowiae]
HEDVIEWIPFNRLINLCNIGETRFIAIWIDGIRKVENNAQSRSSSHIVELKASDNLQISALDFIRYVTNNTSFYLQFKNQDKEHKVYGVTQDTLVQYIVVVNFNPIGNKKYGACKWSEHYNTSREWCQLCDPFRITQGWTSESIDIDNFIKEFQSIATDDLALKICNGLRSNCAQGTPDLYVDFAKLFVDYDPQKRPTAKVIFKSLKNELDELDEPETVEIGNQFWESDEIVKQLPVTLQKHQDDTYTSQFIDTYDISQRYNKFVKSINISQRHDKPVNISTTDFTANNLRIVL